MYIKKQIMQTRLSTWHCPHLLLSAVLLIDNSDQQQTRRTPLLRSNDGTHRRTDGRYIEPGAHTVRAVA